MGYDGSFSTIDKTQYDAYVNAYDRKHGNLDNWHALAPDSDYRSEKDYSVWDFGGTIGDFLDEYLKGTDLLTCNDDKRDAYDMPSWDVHVDALSGIMSVYDTLRDDYDINDLLTVIDVEGPDSDFVYDAWYALFNGISNKHCKHIMTDFSRVVDGELKNEGAESDIDGEVRCVRDALKFRACLYRHMDYDFTNASVRDAFRSALEQDGPTAFHVIRVLADIYDMCVACKISDLKFEESR